MGTLVLPAAQNHLSYRKYSDAFYKMGNLSSDSKERRAQSGGGGPSHGMDTSVTSVKRLPAQTNMLNRTCFPATEMLTVAPALPDSFSVSPTSMISRTSSTLPISLSVSATHSYLDPTLFPENNPLHRSVSASGRFFDKAQQSRITFDGEKSRPPSRSGAFSPSKKPLRTAKYVPEMMDNVLAPSFNYSNLNGKKKQENKPPFNGSALPGKKPIAKQIKTSSDKKTYRRKAAERSLSEAGAIPESCVASQSSVLPRSASKEAAVCTSARLTAVFTEKWAGPCFAVSPSPSSLPIPSFTNFPQQRSSTTQVGPCEEFEDLSFSAFATTPSSPLHESLSSTYSYIGQKSRIISVDTAIATKHLRKILNLDL